MGVTHDEVLEEGGLLTNDEVRRRRLAQLVAKHGLQEVASRSGLSSGNLDHVLKKRRQSKVRADGTRPMVQLGDAAARDIETGMGLSRGWMDWPFPHVDFEQYAAMGATQRLIVQGRLQQAIAEQLNNETTRRLDTPSVTNEKVEEHFGLLPPEQIKAAHEHAQTKSRSRATVDPAAPELRQRSLLDDPKKRR